MHIKTGICWAVILWWFAHFASMPVVAQSTQRISGSWFTSEGKVGLVLEKGDLHPYFLYGDCEKLRSHVRLNLKIEPKLFGDAVAKEEYIIVRWGDETSKVDSIVEGVFLNEAGQHAWSPFLTANLGIVNFWLRAARLELTIGVREKDVFKARQTYVLPDENRRTALASFIQS